MVRFPNDSRYWRDRAEKMRRLAESMGHPRVARLMLDLVDDYETRAGQAAQRSAKSLDRAHMGKHI